MTLLRRMHFGGYQLPIAAHHFKMVKISQSHPSMATEMVAK